PRLEGADRLPLARLELRRLQDAERRLDVEPGDRLERVLAWEALDREHDRLVALPPAQRGGRSIDEARRNGEHGLVDVVRVRLAHRPTSMTASRWLGSSSASPVATIHWLWGPTSRNASSHLAAVPAGRSASGRSKRITQRSGRVTARWHARTSACCS